MYIYILARESWDIPMIFHEKNWGYCIPSIIILDYRIQSMVTVYYSLISYFGPKHPSNGTVNNQISRDIDFDYRKGLKAI